MPGLRTLPGWYLSSHQIRVNHGRPVQSAGEEAHGEIRFAPQEGKPKRSGKGLFLFAGPCTRASNPGLSVSSRGMLSVPAKSPPVQIVRPPLIGPWWPFDHASMVS